MGAFCRKVGGWIEQAKALAAQQPGTDCVAKGFPEITSCEHFYEWNAKVQITTWDPTTKDAKHPGSSTPSLHPRPDCTQFPAMSACLTAAGRACA